MAEILITPEEVPAVLRGVSTLKMPTVDGDMVVIEDINPSLVIGFNEEIQMSRLTTKEQMMHVLDEFRKVNE